LTWPTIERRWLRWLTRIAISLVIYLIALEVLLQTMALFIALTGRKVDTSWLTGGQRILCLGDSNTYGLWLERHETYPSQLEAIWNAGGRGPEVEVLNLGFPGTNSSRLRRDVPRMLETFRPSIVILMIGVNDYWTRPVEFERAGNEVNTPSFIERHSRVLKLYDMVRRALDTRKLEVIADPFVERLVGTGEAHFGGDVFELGFAKAEKGEISRPKEMLEENLGVIAANAEASGSKLVLMTYASRFRPYYVANQIIRDFAEESQTPLIDLAEVFRPVCPERDCPELLFPDHHPRAAGYRLIAETILADLHGDGRADRSPAEQKTD
jgi:lysophospholipase L1-like esterase